MAPLFAERCHDVLIDFISYAIPEIWFERKLEITAGSMLNFTTCSNARKNV